MLGATDWSIPEIQGCTGTGGQQYLILAELSVHISRRLIHGLSLICKPDIISENHWFDFFPSTPNTGIAGDLSVKSSVENSDNTK